jgi:hypothetical protein
MDPTATPTPFGRRGTTTNTLSQSFSSALAAWYSAQSSHRKFSELPGNLRLGEQPSFHFNAQTFVKTQQHHWRSGRKQGPVT